MRKRPYSARTRRVARWLGAGACLAAGFALSPAIAQQQRPRAASHPAPEAPAVPPGPVGVWIDHTGRGAVEISPCGQGLCGRIVWLQQPLDQQGQPLRDKLNENRRLRDRPICGLQILGDLKPMRDGSWDSGWIYDPEQGESFDVEVRLTAPDVLQVTGYKGLKFLSETFRWQRAAEVPAPPCPNPKPA
ncbi:MAG: DUF2147 domain-containing protein [Hyphomicrobiaceae bacterium]